MCTSFGSHKWKNAIMPQTMNTFVMKKIGSVGMMEKPIADPGPNDAIVKTTAALVWTSDVHTVGGAIG